MFYPGLLENFIKFIGIHPVGSLVELGTGEGAIVFKLDRGNLLYPYVIVIADKGKNILAKPYCKHLAEGKIKITGVLDPKKYHINIRDYFFSDT